MNIVISATRNLYCALPTLINSIIINNPQAQITVCAQDDVIDTIIHPQVQIINIDKFNIYRYLNPNNPNKDTHWTYMTFSRYFFSTLLPNVDKILYLDVDTIVDHNLNELFELDMSKYLYAAVSEPAMKLAIKKRIIKPYFNAGVVLINLDLHRKINAQEMLCTITEEMHLLYPDQDAMNIIGENRTYFLDNRYNSSIPTGIISDPYIFHWAGTVEKPWNNDIHHKSLWEKYYVPKLNGEK